jgi:3-dehydroquinate dehydratase / shikimate dehydrogenase
VVAFASTGRGGGTSGWLVAPIGWNDLRTRGFMDPRHRTGVDSAGPPSQRRQAAVVAVLDRPAGEDGLGLDHLSPQVTGLEVRADLTGDLDPRLLRHHFAGQLIYSLRSTAEGGRFGGTPAQRHSRLTAAARYYDVVDLEARDLTPDVLARIPAQQRRISWHGGPLDLPALRARFAELAATPARLYVLAPRTTACGQALAPLQLLRSLGRSDVTAFGTGPSGTWSRVLAAWLGAPVVFGRLHPSVDPGVPTIRQLLADYPLPALPPLRCLYGIVGGSVERSMSPRLHNSAYRHLGLPALFLPFQVSELEPAWPDLAVGLGRLGLPLRGTTVMGPHKAAALAVADRATRAARAAGSANLLLRQGGGWLAETTDTDAIATVLNRAGVRLAGRKVAVVGCGGAGRAAAVGLVRAGAETVLVNRSRDRGRRAADLLGLPLVPLAGFRPAGYSLVVHATPLCDELPFQVDRLPPGAVVVDLVYRPGPTALTAIARDLGLRTIDGWEVLDIEVTRQFALMTGHPLPALDRPLLEPAGSVGDLR